jgi:endonuclease/exonuclease/phosphatase family metal-dependent hydrolase
VRIVTWNLRHGAGGAALSALQTDLHADIVLLQEATATPDHAEAIWEKVPGGRWGSAVVTTLAATRRIIVPGYEGWVVGAEIEIELGPLAVFSVHAPTGTATSPRSHYTDEVVTILGLIREAVRPGVHLVVGGDFNFTLGERHASEALKTNARDRRALAAIADAGLVSCWNATHPDQPLPQTLRWSRDKAPGKTAPYHCDGILVPQSWSAWVTCDIHTEERYAVSDHNPVSATLNLPAT